MKSMLSFLLAAPLLAGPVNYVTNGGFETGATSGVLSPSIPADLIYVFGVGGATGIGRWTVSNSPNNNGSITPLSVAGHGQSAAGAGERQLRRGFRSLLEHFHGRAPVGTG